MSDVLMLSAIVMLVLLFLKVPVYIAVLGGSHGVFRIKSRYQCRGICPAGHHRYGEDLPYGHPVLYLCGVSS